MGAQQPASGPSSNQDPQAVKRDVVLSLHGRLWSVTWLERKKSRRVAREIFRELVEKLCVESVDPSDTAPKKLLFCDMV